MLSGVCRHLTHADPSYQFKGWVRTVKGQQQYAPFEFGDAQQQAGASGTMGRPSSPGSKIGLVTVHFHAASLDHVRSGAARTHSEGDWKEAGKTGLKDGEPSTLHKAHVACAALLPAAGHLCQSVA